MRDQISIEDIKKMDDSFSDEEYYDNYKALWQLERICQAIRILYDSGSKGISVMGSRLHLFSAASILDDAILSSLNTKKGKRSHFKGLTTQGDFSYWPWVNPGKEFKKDFYAKYLGK